MVQEENGTGAPVKLRLACAEPLASALGDEVAAGATRARRRVETYFDTEDFALARQNLHLSRRKRRGGFDLALNGAGEEVVAPLDGETPDIAVLPPSWANALSGFIGKATLLHVFTADLKTLTRHTQAGVELHLITGTLAAGKHKTKLNEIELTAPFGDTALELTQAAPLVLQPLCPAARGLALAGGPAPEVVRAGAGLGGAPSLDEAIATLISACLAQFTGNWPVFTQGDSVGAVHQMRVAMRRLRSLLGLFHRVLPCAEFLAMRTQAKDIANALGDARNWDVFIALVKKGPSAAFPHEPGFVPLLKDCAHHRAAGYAKVRALLADPATTSFVLHAEAFVAKRGWRNAASPEALMQLTAPALDFAALSLARLHKKVRKRGKNLLSLPAHDRHQVRIELKKLRYAGELFGGLFSPRARLRGYNAAAAGLQEQLGLLNDAATALDLLENLDAQSPALARATGLVAGWCARGAQADDVALAQSWKAFKALKAPEA